MQLVVRLFRYASASRLCLLSRMVCRYIVLFIVRHIMPVVPFGGILPPFIALLHRALMHDLPAPLAAVSSDYAPHIHVRLGSFFFSPTSDVGFRCPVRYLR